MHLLVVSLELFEVVFDGFVDERGGFEVLLALSDVLLLGGRGLDGEGAFEEEHLFVTGGTLQGGLTLFQ